MKTPLPHEIWLRVVIEKRKAAMAGWLRKFRVEFTNRYKRSSSFSSLKAALSRHCAPARMNFLVRFPDIRAEWWRCPLDWFDMLESADAELTLEIIAKECQSGFWGGASSASLLEVV